MPKKISQEELWAGGLILIKSCHHWCPSFSWASEILISFLLLLIFNIVNQPKVALTQIVLKSECHAQIAEMSRFIVRVWISSGAVLEWLQLQSDRGKGWAPAACANLQKLGIKWQRAFERSRGQGESPDCRSTCLRRKFRGFEPKIKVHQHQLQPKTLYRSRQS